MADKSVGELIAAQSVTPTDLFVLEQNGTAKKLTGQTLENWLLSFAEGHGGIQSIVKKESSGLNDTYRITLSDTTVFDFVVSNGKGITTIEKTSASGLVDTYTITFNDGSKTTFTVANGEKGDKGDNTYTHIKFASKEPTEESHSMGDVPDKWIGLYWGSSPTAPTLWDEYKWYQFQGDKGDTGSPATLESSVVEYQAGDYGNVIPSETWTDSIPAVPQGKYLWTRITQNYNTGSPVVAYSVARMGRDGYGSVVSVNNVSPDDEGNVTLTAENVGARENTWLPTLEDIGAAPNEGTLKDVRLFGVYPGVECTAQLAEAVKQCRRLYFPAGVYTFSGVTITDDTVFVMDPDAHFHTNSTEFMLNAYNCSFSMHGGKISSGTDYPDRHKTPYDDDTRTMIGGNNGGIIALYGCHSCVIDGVTSPYSNHGSVFTVYGDSTGTDGQNRPVTINGESVVPGRSKDIRFINCTFNNFLLSAIHILYGNDNVVVDGCTFINSLRAKGVPYGYTVYTGVRNIATDAELYYTPTNGYVVRNCYIENCEGTGIDCHTASNVLYENNKLIDCDSFITAYLDYKRVKTSPGWIMENIIVRNNWCRTTKAFDYNSNEYPHNPFMLHSQGKMGMMRNVVVENNYIETNWDYNVGGDNWTIMEVYWTDSVTIRNNVFVATAEKAIAFNIYHNVNVDVDNITLIGAYSVGIKIRTAICRIGKINCARATFGTAVLQNGVEYFSVVDTDGLIINNPTATWVDGWNYVLNRPGKLLQSLDTIAPLNPLTFPKHNSYFGKKALGGPKIRSVAENVVTVGANRIPTGTRVVVGDGVYYVSNITSNNDRTEFYVELNTAPTAEHIASATYLYVSVPHRSDYEAAAATSNEV